MGSGLGELKCCTLIGGMSKEERFLTTISVFHVLLFFFVDLMLQATALAKKPHVIYFK